MISGGIEVNEFRQIHLIEAKFRDDPQNRIVPQSYLGFSQKYNYWRISRRPGEIDV